MATNHDFYKWQIEHRFVLPHETASASSWGELVQVLLLLPVATFIVVEALLRPVG